MSKNHSAWQPHRMRLARVATLACLVSLQAGCRSLPTFARQTEAPPRGPVSRAAALWSEAVLRENNFPVMQGFAAKVYLFGPSNGKPVTAPGKFTIYAFDDTARAESGKSTGDVKPARTWVFQETELRPLLK